MGWKEFRRINEQSEEEEEEDDFEFGQKRQKRSREWKAPKPLYAFKLPGFPTQALPDWLRNFVEGLAEATQTPSDMAAMMSLAAIAASTSKKAIIQLDKGWKEPLNIYATVVLPPASRKSAVIADVAKPLENYEEKVIKEKAEEVAELKSRRRILELRLSQAERAAASANDDSRDELTLLAADLAQELEQMPPATTFRLLVEDTTPEKLVTIMAENKGKLAVLSAEGDLFDIIGGRHSERGKTPNLGPFLKGHTGEILRIDRVGRPSEFVERPALTLGLAVQPDVLTQLRGGASLRGRGMLARILYSLPQNNIGYRKTRPVPLSNDIEINYETLVTRLLTLEPDIEEFLEIEIPHLLQLSEEASVRFEKFRIEVEEMLRPGAGLGQIADWGGKLCGAVGRIAGLLHCAEVVVNLPDDKPSLKGHTVVSRATMESAISIGRYLAEHARAAFTQMGANLHLADAEYVLDWIKRSQTERFSKREAHHELQGRFAKSNHLDPALAVLTEYGYIRAAQPPEREGAGRKPSPEFEVNPLFTESTEWTKYADAPIFDDSVDSVDEEKNKA
jgi:hypothetical protein